MLLVLIVGAIGLADEVELEVEYVALLVHEVLLVLALDLHALELLALVHDYRGLLHGRLALSTALLYQALHTAAFLVGD